MSWLSDFLAECERNEAVQRMTELRQLLRDECLHYGPVSRKFDGGRLPLYCDMCGDVIAYGGEGQVKVNVRLRP